MTYSESAEGVLISRSRAIRELDLHGIIAEDREVFFAEVGDRAEYQASDVLAWLGY